MTKKVLYLSGGTMRGIFAGGVVTEIEDAEAYENIEAIYASSAGALAAAYLLARQTRLGSSIFYENLTKGFISVRDFWGGMWDRLVAWFFGRSFEDCRDAIDIEYLFDVVRRKKVLNLTSLKISPIPLWVKVLDIESARTLYLDIKKHDALELLKASVSMVPYVHKAVTLDGRQYADASIVEPIGIEEIRRRHPESEILIIFSGDPHFKLVSKLKNHIEGFFAHLMYGRPYYRLFASAYKNLRRELDLIENDKKVLFISPPVHCPTLTRTCDREKLIATYGMGIRAGEKAVDFLRN